MQKISMVESVSDSIVEIDPRPSTLLKRSFHQRGFPVDTSK